MYTISSKDKRHHKRLVLDSDTYFKSVCKGLLSLQTIILSFCPLHKGLEMIAERHSILQFQGYVVKHSLGGEIMRRPKWVLPTFYTGGVRVNIWGLRFYKEVTFGVCELQLKNNSIARV